MRPLGQVGKAYDWLWWCLGALLFNVVLGLLLPSMPAAYFGGIAMGYALSRVERP